MFGFLQKTTDPVCKMKVDKDKTKYFSEYRGTKYYFCSQNCKEKFEADPKTYIGETSHVGGCCH